MNKEFAVSFVLALTFVGAALWMLNAEYTRTVNGTMSTSTSAPSAPSSLTPLPSVSKEQASDASLRQPDALVQDSERKPGQIRRCIVNGKTVYSDEKCPDGAESQELELHYAAGIVSPPKAVLGELTAQRKAAELAAEQEREQQRRLARTSQSKQVECQWLEKRIEYLDSLARQPQFGYTQDQIKEEKAAARSRQFAIHC